MSGYSYTELQKMQAKAMERVREMKRNSDIVTQSAQKEFDYLPERRDTKNISSSISARVTNMPPNFPKDNSYPSFKEFFNEKELQKEIPKPVNNSRKGSLENLFDEPDKALILGLIMLLKSEGADESLIMALSYILS